MFFCSARIYYKDDSNSDRTGVDDSVYEEPIYSYQLRYQEYTVQSNREKIVRRLIHVKHKWSLLLTFALVLIVGLVVGLSVYFTSPSSSINTTVESTLTTANYLQQIICPADYCNGSMYAQCAPHYCLYDGEMVETILLTISQYYKMELQIDAALSCIPCCHQYSSHSKMPSKYINSI